VHVLSKYKSSIIPQFLNIIPAPPIVDTRCLIINDKFQLDDKAIIKNIKHLINEFADKWRKALDEKTSKQTEGDYNNFDVLINAYKKKLSNLIPNNEELIANYVIKVSYSNMSISKVLAWKGYGDYIIKNLKDNTPITKRTMIVETPYKTEFSYEYLGKYYDLRDGEKNV
jgi:ATP/maltotriose-dependent transcriptional regulator MalT